MRIISWNINSIRARLPRLLALLRRHNPDIICLQETKVPNNGGFPVSQLEAAGYRSILHGQESYNGVAILIRDSSHRGGLNSFSKKDSNNEKIFNTPTEIQRGFPNDPAPHEKRVVSARIGNFRLVNVYVVNGRNVEDEQFKLKERWMSAFADWIHNMSEDLPLLVVGDFNVVPDDRDVWDPIGLRGRIHCTDEERIWLKNIQREKLRDLMRVFNGDEKLYTWWPYQEGAFDRDEGLRFDLVLGDEKISKLIQKIWIDKEERKVSDKLEKPSDHAPIIIDLAELK